MVTLAFHSYCFLKLDSPDNLTSVRPIYDLQFECAPLVLKLTIITNLHNLYNLNPLVFLIKHINFIGKRLVRLVIIVS